MKKVKIGVMGVYRGTSMINYCTLAENAEIVAICDKWKEGVEKQKEIKYGRTGAITGSCHFFTENTICIQGHLYRIDPFPRG